MGLSSASPTSPCVKLTLDTRVRRNETVQLGQQKLGTEGEAQMALDLQEWVGMKGENEYVKLDLPVRTQLVN